jgi:radical SAM-linked protein
MKVQRCRIHFSKNEVMRYTGHLDLILTWERTFRRAGLPLSYSEGFNPRPVINLASPLPLGFTSTAEIGDFWLSEFVAISNFTDSLREALPPGLAINHVKEVEEIFGAKLPSLVVSATYTADIQPNYPKMEQKVRNLLNQKTILRTKRGKQYDLRPLVQNIEIAANEETQQSLNIKLVTLPDKTGRPDEVLAALDIKPDHTRITRTFIELRSEDKN